MPYCIHFGDSNAKLALGVSGFAQALFGGAPLGSEVLEFGSRLVGLATKLGQPSNFLLSTLGLANRGERRQLVST
jgi:hypothetical protein